MQMDSLPRPLETLDPHLSLMKIIYTLSIAAVCTSLFAESNSKGPNSPVVVGTLKSSTDSGFQVLQEGDQLRDLKLTEKSNIHYVGIPTGADHIPTVGYGVAAKVEKDGSIKDILFTQPVGKTTPFDNERLTMSAEMLFAKADADHNGGVDYVEFARTIYHSPKHGPDGFRKADKNSDSVLDKAEFVEALSKVSWWKLSRKTPDVWFSQADKNGDGMLDIKEFAGISTSGNHIENIFKRTDRDESGSLNQSETAVYIRSVTHGKERSRKKRKRDGK